MPIQRPWVCAQLGSREHYAIPRVLHADGQLKLLLTDYWSGGSKPRGQGTAAKVAQRYHPALADAAIEHLGIRRIAFDLLARLTRRSPGETILRRNAWFQRQMVARLRRRHFAALQAIPGVFFSYSYAASELIEFFKRIGWKIVLGQIDPGIREEEIVAAEQKRRPDVHSSWTPFPAEYWRLWRDECRASDVIAVNSPWSAEALWESGIDRTKITILPLAFEKSGRSVAARNYPTVFTDDRPLRVLFLGQIVLRKGAHLALDAARLMLKEPVEWHFVGPAEITCPPDLQASGRVHWRGAVSRAETVRLYAETDVLLLPTLSDGFALTQLEAQACGQPVVASKFCGAVVTDGVNGRIIEPLDPEHIAGVLRKCLANPPALSDMARHSTIGPAFSLESLRQNLRAIELQLHVS